MKQDVIEKMKHWWSTIGREIGQTDYTIATASVGAPEALIAVDVRVRDMAELNDQWTGSRSARTTRTLAATLSR